MSESDQGPGRYSNNGDRESAGSASGASSSSEGDDDSSVSSGSSSAASRPDQVASAATSKRKRGDGLRTSSRNRPRKRRAASGKDPGSVAAVVLPPTKPSRDAYRRERTEVHDALEHLGVVGNAWRHHDWRLRQWRDVARPEEVRYRSLHPHRRRRLVHPRDARECIAVMTSGPVTPDGPAASEPPPPPPPQTGEEGPHHRLRAMDDEWDAECFGDGVRLQEFYDRSLDAVHCPVRTLVLRAWERAMSVASNTVTATAATTTTVEKGNSREADASERSVPPGAPRSEPSSESFSPGLQARGRLLTRSMGLAQCELLNLKLEDPDSGVCRTCGVEFDTRSRVLDHYYGDDHVRGCCWILIRREQEKLIRQMLQDQVEDHIARLLRSVAAFAPPPLPPTEEGDEGSWDWQDVVEAVVERASSTIDGEEAATTPTGPRHSPAAVDAATRRLVERYANVPR